MGGVFFVKNGKWGCFFCKKSGKWGVHHRFQCFFHLQAHSLRKGDEHPTYTPHGVWHSLLLLADAGYKAWRCPEGGTRFFRKKVDLSSMQGALCTVSIFFILHFTFYLFGGAYAPNAPPPPCLRACICWPTGPQQRTRRDGV